MTFMFGLLDVLLTTLLLFDTLGLAYKIRKGPCEREEYLRVCLSWILFLTISSLFSCNRKGFTGTILRIIIFVAKACVTLPILQGTMKIYKYLIEDHKAEIWFKKITDKIKCTLCKGGQCPSSSFNPQTANSLEETVTPQ